jgi:hypothetical protein
MVLPEPALQKWDLLLWIKANPHPRSHEAVAGTDSTKEKSRFTTKDISV